MQRSLALFLLLSLSTFIYAQKQISAIGEIYIDQDNIVPFNMEINSQDNRPRFTVINGEEKIAVSDFERKGDSLIFRMPIFQGVFIVKASNDRWNGLYYPKGFNESKPYHFEAQLNKTDRFYRFSEPSEYNISGRWKIIENPGTSEEAILIGEFNQVGNHLTGTILNPTGDYRYLDGKVSGNKMMLSAFDGSHQIVLSAKVAGDSLLNGRFIGSPRWKSNWVAVKDPNIELPPMERLVWLKPNATSPNISLPNTENKTVSIDDPAFAGKVIILQIMGTWCPNCLDEARLFNELINKEEFSEVVVLGLCFEGATYENSVNKMKRFALQANINYPLLYAGKAGSQDRNNLLNMVEGTMAFPTVLYLDKSHKPRYVTTGFSGPGTGVHYQQTKDDIVSKLKRLLTE